MSEDGTARSAVAALEVTAGGKDRGSGAASTTSSAMSSTSTTFESGERVIERSRTGEEERGGVGGGSVRGSGIAPIFGEFGMDSDRGVGARTFIVGESTMAGTSTGGDPLLAGDDGRTIRS